MERDALRALLQRVDDPVFPQFPGGWEHWDEQAAEDRFMGLVEALADRLGYPALREPDPWPPSEEYRLLWERTLLYEIGNAIQDASFHAQIQISPPLLSATGRELKYIVSLRLSNFSNLATIYDDDTMVDPEVLAIIQQMLEKHDYIYIPSDLLTEPYTGKNPGVSGFPNRGMRYFDWI